MAFKNYPFRLDFLMFKRHHWNLSWRRQISIFWLFFRGRFWKILSIDWLFICRVWKISRFQYLFFLFNRIGLFNNGIYISRNLTFVAISKNRTLLKWTFIFSFSNNLKRLISIELSALCLKHQEFVVLRTWRKNFMRLEVIIWIIK